MHKENQSIIEILFNYMPELTNKLYYKNNSVSDDTAKKIYAIWKDSGDKLNSNIFPKPAIMSRFEVESLEKEGYCIFDGKNIELTDKAFDVIKVMILGDERSKFEDNGKIKDYSKALSTTKGIK
jgi:hypothetical protein